MEAFVNQNLILGVISIIGIIAFYRLKCKELENNKEIIEILYNNKITKKEGNQ